MNENIQTGQPEAQTEMPESGDAVVKKQEAVQNDARARQWAMIEYVASAESPSSPPKLRVGAVEWLLYLMHEDQERALDLFERLLDGHPIVLESRYTQDFVYRALFKHFSRVKPVVVALMNKGLADTGGDSDSEIDLDDTSADSSDAACRQRGAELACLAWLSPGILVTSEEKAEAQAMAAQAKCGRVAWRRGAARIFAHNMKDDEVCAQELLPLLNDENDHVRNAAAEAVRYLRSDHGVARGSRSRRTLIESFASSRAVDQHSHDFCEYLLQNGFLDPVWSLSIVERLLDNSFWVGGWGGLAGGEELVRLVLRIANHPTSVKETRHRAMDCFDRLMERFAGVAHTVLAELDRL